MNIPIICIRNHIYIDLPWTWLVDAVVVVVAVAAEAAAAAAAAAE